jgi:hypothetical protein
MAEGMGAPVYQAEGMVGLKIKELTLVNDCFQDKCNADSGLYGQTLFKNAKLRVTLQPEKNNTGMVVMNVEWRMWNVECRMEREVERPKEVPVRTPA